MSGRDVVVVEQKPATMAPEVAERVRGALATAIDVGAIEAAIDAFDGPIDDLLLVVSAHATPKRVHCFRRDDGSITTESAAAVAIGGSAPGMLAIVVIIAGPDGPLAYPTAVRVHRTTAPGGSA